MASLDNLCSNPLNLKNKITEIEHKKIFCGPSKILKNISWRINICLKYFMTPTKSLWPPSYILNVQSLSKGCHFVIFIHSVNLDNALSFCLVFAYVINMNIKVYLLVNFNTKQFLKFTVFNNFIVNADA